MFISFCARAGETPLLKGCFPSFGGSTVRRRREGSFSMPRESLCVANLTVRCSAEGRLHLPFTHFMLRQTHPGQPPPAPARPLRPPEAARLTECESAPEIASPDAVHAVKQSGTAGRGGLARRFWGRRGRDSEAPLGQEAAVEQRRACCRGRLSSRASVRWASRPSAHPASLRCGPSLPSSGWVRPLVAPASSPEGCSDHTVRSFAAQAVRALRRVGGKAPVRRPRRRQPREWRPPLPACSPRGEGAPEALCPRCTACAGPFTGK